MKIAFTGRSSLGGVRLRSISIAHYLCCDFVDANDWWFHKERYDAVVVTKYYDKFRKYASAVAGTIIYDPLDSYPATRNKIDPIKYWRRLHTQYKFDAIIATSPACRDLMERSLSQSGVRVYLIPHHADPCIRGDWHSRDGHVIYAGSKQYLKKPARKIIKDACEKIGRKFIIDFRHFSQYSTKGACLILNPRPNRNPLGLYCKPQIKMANAAAAGIPVIATADPCVLSLYPMVAQWDIGRDWPHKLISAIDYHPVAQYDSLEDSSKLFSDMLQKECDGPS